MAMVEFKILGVLPSVNLHINKEKTYTDTKEFLIEMLEREYGNYKPIDFPVKMIVYHYLFEDNYYRQDIDNKQKIIQDVMKGIIIEDDSLICAIHSEKRIAKSEEYFTVLIEEYYETYNENSGEIIGNIGDSKDKIIKARENELSIKAKKINELEDEIERLQIIKDDYKKEINYKISEINGLKKILEERERNIGSKESAIESHKRDKELLKKEKQLLLKEIENLKNKIIEVEHVEENDILNIEENWKQYDVEEILKNEKFEEFENYVKNEEESHLKEIENETLSNKIIKLSKYTSNKANESFLTEIVLDFNKNKKISKNKLKNKVSCDRIKKIMRDIFKINLVSDGEYLIEKTKKDEEELFNIEIEKVN